MTAPKQLRVGSWKHLASYSNSVYFLQKPIKSTFVIDRAACHAVSTEEWPQSSNCKLNWRIKLLHTYRLNLRRVTHLNLSRYFRALVCLSCGNTLRYWAIFTISIVMSLVSFRAKSVKIKHHLFTYFTTVINNYLRIGFMKRHS